MSEQAIMVHVAFHPLLWQECWEHGAPREAQKGLTRWHRCSPKHLQKEDSEPETTPVEQ